MLLSLSTLLDRTHFSRVAIQEGGKRFLRRNISLFYLIPYLHTLEKLTTIYLVFSFLIYRMEKYLVRHGYQVSQVRSRGEDSLRSDVAKKNNPSLLLFFIFTTHMLRII